MRLWFYRLLKLSWYRKSDKQLINNVTTPHTTADLWTFLRYETAGAVTSLPTWRLDKTPDRSRCCAAPLHAPVRRYSATRATCPACRPSRRRLTALVACPPRHAVYRTPTWRSPSPQPGPVTVPYICSPARTSPSTHLATPPPLYPIPPTCPAARTRTKGRPKLRKLS